MVQNQVKTGEFGEIQIRIAEYWDTIEKINVTETVNLHIFWNPSMKFMRIFTLIEERSNRSDSNSAMIYAYRL